MVQFYVDGEIMFDFQNKDGNRTSNPLLADNTHEHQVDVGLKVQRLFEGT